MRLTGFISPFEIEILDQIVKIFEGEIFPRYQKRKTMSKLHRYYASNRSCATSGG